jgi:hypothetical protein
MGPTDKQVTLLLTAVEELARERRASDDPRAKEEAEILAIFRSQLLDELVDPPPRAASG